MTEQAWADPSALATWQAGDPTTALAAAEAAVRSYCGWHIAPSRTEDVVVDGSGVTVQPLPTLYLTAVNSLTEISNWFGSDTSTDLTIDVDFQWSRAGYLTRGRFCQWPVWTSRVQGILANITHGYTEVPAEVLAVVLSAASRGVAALGLLQRVGQVSYATGPGGYPVGLELSDAEKDAISRYRIPQSR